MPKRYFIIDGYNLLFQTGLARNVGAPGGLQRARRALLGALSLYLSNEEQLLTTIVFDAREVLENEGAAAESNGAFRVEYAGDYDSADAKIEAILQRHSAPKQVLVISSDHRVQAAARRRRASFVDAGPWWDQLRESWWRRDQMVSDEANDRVEAADDTERQSWLDTFLND